MDKKRSSEAADDAPPKEKTKTNVAKPMTPGDTDTSDIDETDTNDVDAKDSSSTSVAVPPVHTSLSVEAISTIQIACIFQMAPQSPQHTNIQS